MGGANGCRGEHTPLRMEPARGKVSQDGSEPQGKVPWDILKDHESGSALVNDPVDVRPEVPGVVDARALPCNGEWLAGVSPSDDIHSATPCSSVEGAEVRPDRAAIQGRFFHPAHEDGCSVGVPLDVAHADHAETLQGEIESADAGAEREGT